MTTTTEEIQKATFLPSAKEKFSLSHRKEGKCQFDEWAALAPVFNEYSKKTELKTIVSLRLYYTGTTSYACIWINGKQIHSHGSGSAGGYGYHKPSAAAAEAIRNAKFDLSIDISGVGDSAIEIAVLSIAKTVGYAKAMIHHAHQ